MTRYYYLRQSCRIVTIVSRNRKPEKLMQNAYQMSKIPEFVVGENLNALVLGIISRGKVMHFNVLIDGDSELLLFDFADEINQFCMFLFGIGLCKHDEDQ